MPTRCLPGDSIQLSVFARRKTRGSKFGWLALGGRCGELLRLAVRAGGRGRTAASMGRTCSTGSTARGSPSSPRWPRPAEERNGRAGCNAAVQRCAFHRGRATLRVATVGSRTQPCNARDATTQRAARTVADAAGHPPRASPHKHFAKRSNRAPHADIAPYAHIRGCRAAAATRVAYQIVNHAHADLARLGALAQPRGVALHLRNVRTRRVR